MISQPLWLAILVGWDPSAERFSIETAERLGSQGSEKFAAFRGQECPCHSKIASGP